jgi:hypothetical protein
MIKLIQGRELLRSPKEPQPRYSNDLWKPVGQVDLLRMPRNSLISFQGIHTNSHYVMRIADEDRDHTELWHRDYPGCFRVPTETWNQAPFTSFELGGGYLVPHFKYKDSGLVDSSPEEERAETFTGIWVQEQL